MSEKVTAEKVKELRERTGVGMGKCKEALEQVGGDMERAIDFLRKAGMASAVKKEGRETKEGLVGYAEGKTAFSLVEMNAETDFVTQNEKFKEFLKEVCSDAAETKPASLEAFLAQKNRKDSSITNDEQRAIVMQSLGENIRVKRLTIIPKSPDLSIGFYSHMGGKIVCVVELQGGAGQEALARDIAMHIAAESPDYLAPQDVPSDVKSREEEVARGQVQGKPANIVDKIVEGKLKAFYDMSCLVCQKYVKDNSITITQLLENESKRLGKKLAIKRFLRWQVGA
ncbi:MAG: elongation factor Ts [Chlamydiales bacterium]|nr:elongation factor Ts [Chlamydiales bacterium]